MHTNTFCKYRKKLLASPRGLNFKRGIFVEIRAITISSILD